MKRLYDKALMDQIAKVYGNEVTFLSEFSKALLDIIREGLIRDGQVRLHQFGTFKLKWMKSRVGVNPSTGKKIIIQARPRVVFVPAKALKDRIEPHPPELQPFEQDEEIIVSKVTPSKMTPLQNETIATEAINDHSEEKIDISEPEKVVADIQDEIEVLEQVVEILKTETPEPVDAITADSASQSEWLDKSVVEDIKGISELQYFKKTENTESTVSNDQSFINNDVALDIDLNTFSQENNPPKRKYKENKSGKVWFAIAATVIVLLAAGVLFNALDSNNSMTQSDVVAINDNGPQYLYSYTELSVEEKVTMPPVHVPLVIDNENMAFETVDRDSSETDVAQSEIVNAVSNVRNNDSIVISTEKYDELQSLSAERKVYFSERDHKLVNGDSLWRLAKKHYINPFYWPHIYQANRNKINNPDKVKIGKVVSLPALYGRPDALTKQDKHNIAMGYYYNYLYHKGKGNPYAYFSLIGVEKYDANILIEYKEEIEYSDVNNLALLTE